MLKRQCWTVFQRLTEGMEHLAVGDKGAEDGLSVFAWKRLVALVLGQSLLALGPTAAHPNACL